MMCLEETHTEETMCIRIGRIKETIKGCRGNSYMLAGNCYELELEPCGDALGAGVGG